MIVAAVAALIPVVVGVVFPGDEEGVSDKSSAPSGSSVVKADATPRCRGTTCIGLDPEKAGCTSGTVSLRDEWAGLMHLEIRYNPGCEAIWAKLTGAGPGDTVTITTSPSRRQSSVVEWGKTQYTKMLSATPRTEFSAQAAAVATEGYPEQEIPKGHEILIGADETHFPSASPNGTGSTGPSGSATGRAS